MTNRRLSKLVPTVAALGPHIEFAGKFRTGVFRPQQNRRFLWPRPNCLSLYVTIFMTLLLFQITINSSLVYSDALSPVGRSWSNSRGSFAHGHMYYVSDCRLVFATRLLVVDSRISPYGRPWAILCTKNKEEPSAPTPCRMHKVAVVLPPLATRHCAAHQ